MIAYIITREDDEVIPDDATHFSVHGSVRVIPAWLIYEHQNIVELICHDGVERIEEFAFHECPRLRRVVIPGVRVVEWGAFCGCGELEYVECPKLEKIWRDAFHGCKSLRNINLTSAKVVARVAFRNCEALTEAKFGKELESVEWGAFCGCRSLESITIPLKNGLLTNDDVLQMCENLRSVYLVEAEMLDGTVAALLLEEWRNDINEILDSINQILPNASAGEYDYEEDIDDDGEKAIAIREWIARILDKIIDYKAQHRRILRATSSSLQLALPNDIVTNYVVPFLELPLHTFDGEGEDEHEDEYTSEDEDGEEENGEDNSHDQLQDDSVAGDREDDEAQQQQNNEGGRKRRRTAQYDDP